jgi:hypothetical protein
MHTKGSLSVSVIGVHSNFWEEDIVLCVLKNLTKITHVSDISKADIVILGPYQYIKSNFVNKNGYISKIKSFLKSRFESRPNLISSLRSTLDPCRKQIWLHVSGEAPNINSLSSFLNSNCDYGIGHELIQNNNYTYMPHWFQSIDWSFQGFYRSENAFTRFGRPINIIELTSGHSNMVLKQKNKRCAVISSHLTSPRDVLIKELEKIMPVDIFGINGSGPPQKKCTRFKREILSEYSFNLCPENRLYPGYITEKIPEAFASGSYPIGWYLSTNEIKFNSQAHTNVSSFGDKSLSGDGILASEIDIIYSSIIQNGIPPLISQKFSLEPVIGLVSRVISDAISRKNL